MVFCKMESCVVRYEVVPEAFRGARETTLQESVGKDTAVQMLKDDPLGTQL